MRVAGPPRPGTIRPIQQRPRGRRVLSDTEDDEKPVVDDENTTVVEEKPPSVWQRLTLKQLRWTAVAVILVLTAAFGGLKTAHHVTPISFGQTYNAGAMLVTPHSASLTDHWIGLPRMSPECRYLVLKVTIQNTTHESVPFPLQGALTSDPGDCAPHHRADAELFALTGIANQFAATFRGKETIAVPSIDAGFTYDYSVLWVVSRAELSHHPVVTVRIHKMSTFISTFVLSHRWAGDDDHFAELHISNLETS
jgi:hypothetical protein